MPHREAAWALLAERLDEAAGLCLQIRDDHDLAVAERLAPVLGALREMSRTLAAELPAGTVHARLVTAPDPLAAGQLEELRGRARQLARQAGGQGELADLFGAVYAIVLAADRYPAVQQALIVPRLVDSVLRPLAGELDAGAAADPPGEADTVWAAAQTATALRARLAGDCPPGLAEAVAALQDLAGQLAASPVEARTQLDELWQLQAALPPELRIARNGPYLVTSVPRLTDYLGAQTRPAPQLALCRCGQSALKPLCDGSHARIGFTDAKDPKRVPDHRDASAGQQATIFDNRGVCQHSGLCTDRLATVFRTNAEPFVAPERRPPGRDHPRRTGLPVRGAELRHRRRRGPRPGRLGRHQAARHRGDQGWPVPDHRPDHPGRRRRASRSRRAPGPRASTTPCAAAGSRATSPSAAACTGTSASATPCRPDSPTLYQWAGGGPR